MNQSLTQVIYLEQYIESTYFVPTELSRLLNTIKALDERCINLSWELQQSTDALLTMPPAHLLPQPSEEYMQLIKKVDEDQGMLAQFCEEKVQVSQQAYEFLEMHALELERTMESFESDLRVSGGLALDTTDFGISTAIENLAEMYTPGALSIDPRGGRTLWTEEGDITAPTPASALRALPLPGLPVPAGPLPLTSLLASLQPLPTPVAGSGPSSGGAGAGAGLKRSLSSTPRHPLPPSSAPASAPTHHPAAPATAPPPLGPKRARTAEPQAVPESAPAPISQPLLSSTTATTPHAGVATPTAPLPPPASTTTPSGTVAMHPHAPHGMNHSSKKRNQAGSGGGNAECAPNAPHSQVPAGRILESNDIGPGLRGQHAELFWPDDNSWYLIEIQDVSLERMAKIIYTTGEEENLDLEQIAKEGHMSLIPPEITAGARRVREARERLKAQESEDRFGPKPVASKPAPVSKPKAKPRDPPLMLETAEESIWQAFADMDVNQDGFIDFAELREALEKLGLPCTPQYLVGLMQEFDVNRDSQIDWSEFKQYVKKREQEFAKAFSAFDSNGDGVISASELRQVLRAAGIPAAASDIDNMVNRVDSSQDGFIDYNEFRKFAAFLPATGTLETPMLYAAWWSSSDTIHNSGDFVKAKAFPFALFFDMLMRVTGSVAAIALAANLINRQNN